MEELFFFGNTLFKKEVLKLCVFFFTWRESLFSIMKSKRRSLRWAGRIPLGTSVICFSTAENNELLMFLPGLV